MYTLRLTTSYAENWRYNIMITLSPLDSSGEQVGYYSAEDSPLPLDSNSDTAPDCWVRRREVTLQFEPSDKVRFYIYLLPNSIPQVTTLAGEQTSFPLQLTICDGEKNLYTEKIEANRFGGLGREFVLNL